MIKERDLNWTNKTLKDFNEVKNKISQRVLILPTAEEPLFLYTDPSQEYVGACLVLNGDNRPVSFASRKLIYQTKMECPR